MFVETAECSQESFLDSSHDCLPAAKMLSKLTAGYLCFCLQCGTELVACLMLMELSNPFMHARELLKELNLKDTSYSFLNDVRCG
jgi:hypothetical protein